MTPNKSIINNSNSTIPFKKFFPLFWILFISYNSFFGQVKSIGLPEIKNYKRADYKGGTQNWNIDQDKNGNLYFANNNGLYQFDGSLWHKYVLPNLSVVRAVKTGKSGEIYVGGYNEFGFFKANLKGKLVYHSIARSLDKKIFNTIDIVWKIHLYKDEVIFQSFNNSFVYKNNTIKILKPFSHFQFSFMVGNSIYFQDVTKGLLEYKNGTFSTIPGSTILNNTEVWGVFQMNNNNILITSIDKGGFIYDGVKISPWNTEANDFIKNNSCLGGVTLKENYIVLNSVLNGIIICDKTGKIVQHINRKKGLQNNTVLTSFIDSKNNLWLGLDNGITFVNENSPISYFGDSYDLSTVYASVVYKGNLYVATNQGVFYHPWSHPFKEGVFKLVEGTNSQAWNVQVFDNQLLCAHNRGALSIEGGKSNKTLDNVGYWSFKKIPNQTNYLIGSNYSGFSLFEKKPDGWQFVSKIEGYSKSVGDFQIDNETIWVKKDNLIYQLVLDANLKKFKSIKTHQNLSAIDKGISSIQTIRNKVYFQTNNHFYKYSNDSAIFYEDKEMTVLFKNIPKTNTIYEDNIGNIWYVSNGLLGVLMKNKEGNFTNIASPFINLTQDLPYNNLSINTLNPENILIGLTEGLAHYNSKISNDFYIKPKAFIRSFSFAGDTIFSGNGQRRNTKYKIPYKSNNIKFIFSSPTFENSDNIKFSYFLEGFDDNWSNWSPASLKEYTNLREGDYSMKVKVKNSYGIQSDESIVPFTISPPWYRHLLAYLIYIIAIAITLFYIRKRIQSKIRKNKYYETIEQRRLYLEKESRIRQEQFELEKEIEKLKNEKLKIQLQSKDKELVNNSLQVVKKNKILNGIIHKLKDINIETFDESSKFQFTKLNKSIVKEVNTDNSWKDLEKHIKNVHFDFLKRLKEKYPTISPRELDLSTYLLMNMSTKEIAEIMNISKGGVELARYRLRKKLELNKKENLIGFLMSI
ncbi:MAG: triple tyrosine motif-containing protein [Flavobacterium sp.]|uniref:helix-turn-helix and ligand-binding sensor domain-containing protein n=1 Tax=Flavobacterium sp. TaxID=239 RepID=UPI002633AEDE|nr:triple tyrosine motif-containing protein [Flavobacterium sp.]MDD5150347.1 triple tyrosine motif-containing protein [Flavobacterium sp.]